MVANPLLLASLQTLDDLRKLGKFHDAKAAIQARLGPHVRVSARGWTDLLKAVESVRSATESGAVTCSPGYFSSTVHEHIFYLVELDGELRLQKLGVGMRHFKDKATAKSWRDALAKELHPDRCPHPRAAAAMSELNKLYTTMSGD